jgi:hypothetical protein
MDSARSLEAGVKLGASLAGVWPHFLDGSQKTGTWVDRELAKANRLKLLPESCERFSCLLQRYFRKWLALDR